MQWLDEVINKYTKPAEGEQPSAVSQPAQENTPNEQFKKYVSEGFLTPMLKPVKQAASNASAGFESLFSKVIKQESQGVHRNADGTLLTSPAGAQGITQIMPKTGKKPGYGIAPLKDDSEGEYLRVGRELLKAYTKEFGGDQRKGLAAYNFGIGNVKRRVEKHGDDWEKALPKETKNYLKSILG